MDPTHDANDTDQEVHGEYPGVSLDELREVLTGPVNPQRPAPTQPQPISPDILAIQVQAAANLKLTAERATVRLKVGADADAAWPRVSQLIPILPAVAEYIRQLKNKQR